MNVSKDDEDKIKQLLQIIKSINYGFVTVIIQEGKIIQFEKNEKLRIK